MVLSKNRLRAFQFFLIAIVVWIFMNYPVNAQTQSAMDSSLVRDLPVDSVFDVLEKKYSIKFFYNEKVIQFQKLPGPFTGLSLEEVLFKMELSVPCTILTVDTNVYVLMPVGVPELMEENPNENVIIGNPSDYGKYKTAKLSGHLIDGKTGEPLVGAVVYLKKLNVISASDKEGKFIMNIPVGEYDLEFTCFGYERKAQAIKIVSPGKAEFELFEKSININEVIIHSEKPESNILNTQMSIVSLDSKSLKELPLNMGEKDILKSLTLLPGIQSVGEFGTGFNVRGGGNDQNLIMVEDAPLFNTSHLFGLESLINPDGVSNLTLLKAGIPAQYGERVSSVTNIRLGNNPQKTDIKGGIGLLSSRLSIETPLFGKKANLLAGGRSSYSNWLLHKIPDPEIINSSANFYDLNLLFNANIDYKNKLTLFGYYSRDNFTYNITDQYSYASTLGTIRWTHNFNDHLFSKLLSAYSLYKYNFIEYDPLLRANAYQINSSLIYNSLKYNITWIVNENYSFDFGLNGMRYRSQPGNKKGYGNDSHVSPVSTDKENGLELAAYASGNMTLTDNIHAEIGLRYTAFAVGEPGKESEFISGADGLEPRISLRYTLNPLSSLKISYNRIHQYINIISNTSVAVPSDIWKLSSEFIYPLIADQLAAGYYRNFRQHTIETSFELYFKNLQHITEYRNGAHLVLNQEIEKDLLKASGYNYGFEFYIRKTAGNPTGWFSYTLSRSMRHTTSSIKDDQINENSYFPSCFDRPHNLNLVANYYLTRRWHVTGSFSYYTGRPVTLPESKFEFGNDWLVIYSSRNKYRLPDYHRLDISLSLDESLRIKKKWKGSWTFSIMNVYGRKNAYSSFYEKSDPGFSNKFKKYGLYTFYLVGKPLPTLTYNFTF